MPLHRSRGRDGSAENSPTILRVLTARHKDRMRVRGGFHLFSRDFFTFLRQELYERRRNDHFSSPCLPRSYRQDRDGLDLDRNERCGLSGFDEDADQRFVRTDPSLTIESKRSQRCDQLLHARRLREDWRSPYGSIDEPVDTTFWCSLHFRRRGRTENGCHVR